MLAGRILADAFVAAVNLVAGIRLCETSVGNVRQTIDDLRKVAMPVFALIERTI